MSKWTGKLFKSMFPLAMAGTLMAGAMTVNAEDSDKVTLSLWNIFTGDDSEVLNGIVDQFNESHPDIQVENIAMSADTDFYVKFPMVAKDESQSPDFVVCHNNYIPQLAEDGNIQPISVITDKFDTLASENFGSAEMAEYNGERYGVILDVPSAVLYGNVELIEQYCPEIDDDYIITWDEIYALGDKLAEEGVIDDIKPLVSSWARNDILQTLMTSGGAYSEDGTTLALTPEMMTAAIEPWKELADKGYFMEEGADGLGMFALGQTVFVTGGTWSLSTIKSYEMDYIMLPEVQESADGEIVTYAAGHCFMLPNHEYSDEKLEAIGTFMEWFEENAMLWAESGALVVYKPVTESEEFKELPQCTVDIPGTIHTNPEFLYCSICDETINTYDWQCVFGHMTPEEYGEAVVAEIKSKIEAKTAG